MARPHQYENGASGVRAGHYATGPYDVHGAYQEAAEPHGPPNVYLPYAEQTPTYNEFADPAAAHGWQNGYDETHELPATAADERSDAHGPRPGEYDGGMHAGHDGSVFVDGSGRRRRLVRPMAIAVGAACVLFIVVVVVGFFNSGPSGSPLPWVQDKGERAKQKTGQTASPTPTEASLSGAGSARPAVPPSPSHASEVVSPSGASKSGSPSGGGDRTTAPATTAPATAPTSTTAAPARGNAGDNPGRGQGSTKAPN
nr:hypothetical protein OG781_31405 [Streptomyces sp. NBC_00830]